MVKNMFKAETIPKGGRSGTNQTPNGLRDGQEGAHRAGVLNPYIVEQRKHLEKRSRELPTCRGHRCIQY
jgi:hypothetical protein